jgi:hypothetical protein
MFAPVTGPRVLTPLEPGRGKNLLAHPADRRSYCSLPWLSSVECFSTAPSPGYLTLNRADFFLSPGVGTVECLRRHWQLSARFLRLSVTQAACATIRVLW